MQFKYMEAHVYIIMNCTIKEFLQNVPERNNLGFLKSSAADFTQKIRKGDELNFLPIDFYTKIVGGTQYCVFIAVAPGGLKYALILDDYKLNLDIDLVIDTLKGVSEEKTNDIINDTLKILFEYRSESKTFFKDRITKDDIEWKVIYANSLMSSKFYFDKRPFLRISFKDKYQYKKAKRAYAGVRDVYSNDPDSDHQIAKRIFREKGIFASSWNKVSDYEIAELDSSCECCADLKTKIKACKAEHVRYAKDEEGKPKGCQYCPYPKSKCDQCFIYEKLLPLDVKHKNTLPCIIASCNNISACTQKEQDQINQLCNNKYLISMAWDIETFAAKKNSIPPPEDVDDYKLFMVTLVFYWHNSDIPILKICLTDKKCLNGKDKYVEEGIIEYNAKKYNITKEAAKKQLAKNIYIINCGSERKVIKDTATVFGRLSPDFTLAFNCSKFDWPVLFAKAAQFRLFGHYKSLMCVDGHHNTRNINDIRPHFLAEDYKSESTGMYDFKLHKHINKHEQIKIPGAAMILKDLVTPMFYGFVNMDIMLLLRVIHPKQEVGNKYSLNFYVQKVYGLGAKYDLDYKTQWEYYSKYDRHEKWQVMVDDIDKPTPIVDKNGLTKLKYINKKKVNAFLKKKGITLDEFKAKLKKKLKKDRKNMTEEALYCFTDSEHCQRLLLASGRLTYLIAVSNITYMLIYDTFWRADGSKVISYLCYQAQSENILINHTVVKSPNKVKYSGAKVYEPKVGMSPVPIGSLDFSSLYPSIMRAYNCSPEKSIIDDGKPETYALVDKLTKMGYTLVRIDTFGKVCKKADYNADEDDYNDYDEPDEVGNKINIKGWLIWHNNVDVPTNDKPLESVGVFAKSVATLIKHRKVYKAKFSLLDGLLERISKYGSNYVKENLDDILHELRSSKKYYEETLGLSINDIDDINKLDIHMNNYNSAQLALKVICNTFYGQQGSSDSPLYNLLVAASIPHFGKKSIETVTEKIEYKKLVTKDGKSIEEPDFVVHYGDTDSNYISCRLDKFSGIECIFNKYKDYILSEHDLTDKDILLINEQNQLVYEHLDQALSDVKSKFASKCNEYINEYKSTTKNSDDNYDKIDLVLAKYTKLYKELAKDVYNIYKNDKPGVEVDDYDLHKVSIIIIYLREEYWTQMVQLTRLYISNLQNSINNHFLVTTKTPYLTLAYEEILYPIILLGKKKYTGIKHADKEIFRVKSAKEIFKRGIEIIKQGQTEFNKNIGNEILMKILGLDNFTTVEHHVLAVASKYFKMELPISNYILTAKIKTNTNNVTLENFKARMQRLYDQHYETNYEYAEIVKPPDYNDNFKYVVIKTPKYYITGIQNKEVQKGDKMMYLAHYEYLKKHNLPVETNPRYYYEKHDYDLSIDHEHYIKNICIGSIARFLTYDERFWVTRTKDQPYAEYDKKIINNIKNYLTKYFSSIFNSDETTRKSLVDKLSKTSKLVQYAIDDYEYKLNIKIPFSKIVDLVYYNILPDVDDLLNEHVQKYGTGPSSLLYIEKVYGIDKKYIKKHTTLYKSMIDKYNDDQNKFMLMPEQDWYDCLDEKYYNEDEYLINSRVKAFNDSIKDYCTKYVNDLISLNHEVCNKVVSGELNYVSVYNHSLEYLTSNNLVSDKMYDLMHKFHADMSVLTQAYINLEVSRNAILL